MNKTRKIIQKLNLSTNLSLIVAMTVSQTERKFCQLLIIIRSFSVVEVGFQTFIVEKKKESDPY